MTRLRIEKLTELPTADLQPLLEESQKQGHELVTRLIEEYESGQNRFDAPGEALFGVYAGRDLIAIGGLNQDPYLPDGQTGRVRHVYVLADWRGRGVGRLLVDRIITEAHEHFQRLTLRTFSDRGDRFFRSLGFEAGSPLPGASHHMEF
ncbi:MAG: GNAT family N-acetyltransferase [Anaerolineae bacterium]|nr:GNAT family N-acetyltransferase [Anaerolineae bacterium]